MIFDAYAYLEKLNSEGATPAISAIPAIPAPDEQPGIAEIAGIAAGQGQKPEKPPEAKTPETFPHGRSVTGNPLTWTGRVVSLDEWRALSEWERHGSTGKMWNGKTRQWQARS